MQERKEEDLFAELNDLFGHNGQEDLFPDFNPPTQREKEPTNHGKEETREKT